MDNANKISNFHILFGRGKGTWNTPGNLILKHMIMLHLSDFVGAATKGGKIKVVNAILEKLEASGARFFRQNNEDGTWHEIHDYGEKRYKVSHSLRDHINRRKKSNNSKALQNTNDIRETEKETVDIASSTARASFRSSSSSSSIGWTKLRKPRQSNDVVTNMLTVDDGSSIKSSISNAANVDALSKKRLTSHRTASPCSDDIMNSFTNNNNDNAIASSQSFLETESPVYGAVPSTAGGEGKRGSPPPCEGSHDRSQVSLIENPFSQCSKYKVSIPSRYESNNPNAQMYLLVPLAAPILGVSIKGETFHLDSLSLKPHSTGHQCPPRNIESSHDAEFVEPLPISIHQGSRQPNSAQACELPCHVIDTELEAALSDLMSSLPENDNPSDAANSNMLSIAYPADQAFGGRFQQMNIPFLANDNDVAEAANDATFLESNDNQQVQIHNLIIPDHVNHDILPLPTDHIFEPPNNHKAGTSQSEMLDLSLDDSTDNKSPWQEHDQQQKRLPATRKMISSSKSKIRSPRFGGFIPVSPSVDGCIDFHTTRSFDDIDDIHMHGDEDYLTSSFHPVNMENIECNHWFFECFDNELI